MKIIFSLFSKSKSILYSLPFIAFCLYTYFFIHINILAKIIIIAGCALLISVYFIIKSLATQMQKKFLYFLCIRLKRVLSNDEFDQYIYNINFNWNYNSFFDIFILIDNYYNYTFEHFSDPKQTLLINTFIDAINDFSHYLDDGDRNAKLPKYSAAQIIKIPILDFIQEYIKSFDLCTDSSTIKKSLKKDLYSICSYIPIFLLILSFYFFKSHIYTLQFIICILFWLIYFFITKKYENIHGALFSYWTCNMIVTIIAPFHISTYMLFVKNEIYYFIINLVCNIINGTWITNKLWKSTKTEKQQNLIISPNSISSLANIKLLAILRPLWLWLSLIIIIFATVFIYSLIYWKHLHIGSFTYCLLLSLSIFFAGGFEIREDIVGLVSASEAFIAFLTNTLFIANIVRLIVDPSINNDKKN